MKDYLLTYIIKIKLTFVKFSDQLKKPDSLQLEISPVMDIIRKSCVTGQTIRTPQILHSVTVDI